MTFTKKKWFFTASMLPIGYLTYSVNCLYLLFYCRFTYRRINDVFLKLFIIYVFISYLFGLLFFIPSEPHFLLSQLASFLFFCSGLFLLFIKFDKDNIDNMLSAAVYASAIYSIWVILMLIKHHTEFPLTNIYKIKNQLCDYVWDWPQTYLPLLVFSFIYNLNKRKTINYYYLVNSVILITIYFTFTRSAYLALASGILLYFITNIFPLSRKKIAVFTIKIIPLILISIFLISNSEIVSVAISSIFERTTDAFVDFFNNAPKSGSDAERTAIVSTVLELAKDYWLTGTGFGGIHLFTDSIGSAHNQYLDTLLKTGIIGLSFMIYIFIKLLRYSFHQDKALFAGIFSLMVYGLFNATYQQPYIMLLLFSLLSFIDYNAKIIARKPTCKI